jgi:hypothetical protein
MTKVFAASAAMLCVFMCTPGMTTPAGWRTTHDARGFSISYPAGWKADPGFADLNYPDNNGERSKIEGLGLRPTAELQPHTTLQSNQVSVAVEVLPPYRKGCVAGNFLAEPPPDYNSGIDTNTPDFAHMSGGDPGDWYSVEDYVYRVSTKPCLAVHYFIGYATRGGEMVKGAKPFDRAALLAQLDHIRATFVRETK